MSTPCGSHTTPSTEGRRDSPEHEMPIRAARILEVGTAAVLGHADATESIPGKRRRLPNEAQPDSSAASTKASTFWREA